MDKKNSNQEQKIVVIRLSFETHLDHLEPTNYD
jgi:hypothetical protein